MIALLLYNYRKVLYGGFIFVIFPCTCTDLAPSLMSHSGGIRHMAALVKFKLYMFHSPVTSSNLTMPVIHKVNVSY